MTGTAETGAPKTDAPKTASGDEPVTAARVEPAHAAQVETTDVAPAEPITAPRAELVDAARVQLVDAARAELIAAARAAMAHAHAPYSRFAVGAAVRLTDGAIITGSNFENASYGLSLCAETVALASVNAAGRLRDVAEIAVAGGAMDRPDNTPGGSIIMPCGRCRQIINEAEQMAGRAIAIHCAAPAGDAVRTTSIAMLLPHAFGPADLGVSGHD